MKNTLLLIACLIFSGSLFAQSYEIDTYNGQTVSTCTGTFYDSGGPSGDYNNSEDYQVTFCSSIPGAQIMVEFTSFQAESPTFDNLTAYQGIGTGGTLIGSWGNNTLQGLTLESTSSGCITFVWHTDGSVIYPGWTANISCTFPCQDFTVDIVNTSIPYTSGDTIDLCQGQSITFTAAGTYPNNNLNYPQSDTTTTFQWDFGDGQQGTGQTITHTFTDGGGYFVTLNAYDVYNCDNVNYVVNMIRVSTTPTFVGTNIIEDTVCAGETINFNGFIQTEPWELAVPPPWAGTTFLPDDASGFYQTAITYEIFTPGQTLTDIYDIESLCLTMEHSYLGDLTLQLICPSGQTMTLVLYDAPQYPVSCGGTFLGVPIDDDGNLNPGTGYEYCWTPVATNGTIQDNCGGWGTTLPSGDYEPLDPWTNLLGCPLNGDWQIYIFDNLYSDNGYIFQWMIDFDPSIIPTNLWVFENSYNPADYIWSGNNITSQTNGVGTAIPMSTGNVNYTFTAIDDFGCSYDTTISVYVLSAGSPGCCSMPAPYAGANDAVCGYSYSLSATLTPGNTGTWSYTGPGTATFTNNTSQTTDVTVDTYGSYNFIWLEQNSPACSNADTVVITFNPTLSSDFSFSGIIPCYGDAVTVTYTGNATPAANYNWNFGAGVATGSGQGPYSVVFPSGTNQVSLSVSELGCSSNATIHTISAPDSLIKKPDWFDNLCYGYCQGWASMGVEGGT
ncbi:MAG: PKD domain-containing protein, partial [Bacteroidia bacterium]|nr:PKD domain-containing protein [Bacteroidia bacterium]